MAGFQVITEGTGKISAVSPSGPANEVLATPNGSSGTASLRALVAADIPSLPESKITNLTTDLAAKVPTSTTVNGHPLSSNVVVSASDLTTGLLAVAQRNRNGFTGIVAGTNVTVTGSWPNQTVNASGGGGGSSSLIQIVQFTTAQSTSGTVACTFTRSAQKASAIVVEYIGVGNVTSISDSQGNSYTQYNPQSWLGPVNLSQFVTLNITGGATITVTATGTGSIATLNVYEYTNVDSVDTSISAVSNTTLGTGSITTTVPSDLIHITGSDNSNGGAVSNGNGWPLIQSAVNTAFTVASYNTTQPTPGAVANIFNSSLAPSGFNHTYAALLALKPRAIPTFGIQTLTTTGTSGSASLVGANLNIPTPAGGGGGGALILLEQHTASSSASLSFTSWYSSSYDVYKIEIVGITVGTNGANLQMQMSTNGGSTYDTGTNYDWQGFAMTNGGTGFNGANAQTSIALMVTMDNTNAHYPGTGSLTLYDPGNTSLWKFIGGLTNYVNTARPAFGLTVTGIYLNASAVNAFRILTSSGTFSGIVRIYGVAH
jgi:hypothetical protein